MCKLLVADSPPQKGVYQQLHEDIKMLAAIFRTIQTADNRRRLSNKRQTEN